MIDGNVKDFIDGLYHGDEMLTEYKGIRYFIQGWYKDGQNHLEICTYDDPEIYSWECDYEEPEKCVEEFLKVPHWDGKTFQEVEPELAWIDD